MVRKLDETGVPADAREGLAVVAFSARWCPPCKVMAPIYEEAAGRFPGMHFLKADQETAPALFERFGVRAVPTYMVLKQGKELNRLVGALPASRFQAWLGDQERAA